MNQEQQEIFGVLADLMRARYRTSESDSCEPFVSATTEFGLRCGPTQQDLLAVHRLLDALRDKSLFVGQRRPHTTLEAMQNVFPEGDTAIYDNVTANRTAGAITLTIRTKREHSEVMAALRAGAAAAQQKEEARREDELRECQRVVALFAKEKANPVFGEEQDKEFVRRYLIAKTNGYFGADAEAGVLGPFLARDHMPSFFSPYGISDNRPRYILAFSEPDGDGAYYKSLNFIISLLPKAFEAPFAVTLPSRQPDRRYGTIHLEVRGNAPRLVRDIIKNDREYALRVAKDMGLTIRMRYKKAVAMNDIGNSRPHACLSVPKRNPSYAI